VVAVFNPDGTSRGAFSGFDPSLRTGVSVETVGGSPGRVVVGTGAGMPGVVRVYGLDGSPPLEITPFDPAFLGGVSVG
jgi:hypothetical protein